MKRYAIVPLDRYNCPKYYCEWFKCKHCGNCAELWGDTKEELIRKVAQVIFKVQLARYRQVWKCECSEIEKRNKYTGSLILARKIVEFLGVEE